MDEKTLQIAELIREGIENYDNLLVIAEKITYLHQAEIAKLRAELKAQAEPDWIPVNVRLPECERKGGAQSEPVACLTNSNDITIGWVGWNKYAEIFDWDWVEDETMGDKIIAWYPLPKRKVMI